MNYGESDVKSKGEVVGKAKFPIFDTIEEAVRELGEKECIDLLNAQVKTNEQNNVRAAATGKPTKARIKEMAVLNITAEELAECAGDQNKVLSLIASKEAEVRAQYGMEED